MRSVRTRTRLTCSFIETIASRGVGVDATLRTTRLVLTIGTMVTAMPVVGMTVTMMVIVSMVGLRHRHFRTMILRTAILRTTRVSVMHATTQQCMKHYRGHRGDREQVSEHGNFCEIRVTGITGTVILSTRRT